jgi:hypothetical protein
MTGIELIAKERQEQIERHGFLPDGDLKYEKGELLHFADYMIFSNNVKLPNCFNTDIINHLHTKSRIEQLAVAGALLAAEIDRRLLVERNKQINVS